MMTRFRMWLMKPSAKICCMVGLCAINIIHVIIHGTPLDGGTLDATIQHLNIWFSANLNTE